MAGRDKFLIFVAFISFACSLHLQPTAVTEEDEIRPSKSHKASHHESHHESHHDSHHDSSRSEVKASHHFVDKDKDVSNTTYRMKLYNFKDMQYTANMKVGNQTIRGILDTGSFELLVFSKWCSSCGVAKAFDPNRSATFMEGKRHRTQTYGSGSCKSVDARDEVRMGPLKARNQAFWKANSCHMPLLDEADFNAVVGIGPPGQPARSAHDGLTQAKKVKNIAKKLRQPISDAVYQLERESLEDLEDAPSKPSMLENFGVSKFSVCLERESGSNGWLVWNDDHDTKGFTDLKVVGEITWSVKLGGMNFIGKKKRKGKNVLDVSLGCKDGCGAILDSGTSLIAVPSTIYKKAFHALSNLDMDCSDMSAWPDLVFRLGDRDFHLPPESYVGQLVGDMPNEVAKLMHLRDMSVISQGTTQNNTQNNSLTKCEFLMMDMGEQKTQLGPMALLGMPFFREFFTTFHIGKGPGTRWVSVAPAGVGCEPENRVFTDDVDLEETDRTRYAVRPSDAVRPNDEKRRKRPRQVDASKLRVPHWHQIGDLA